MLHKQPDENEEEYAWIYSTFVHKSACMSFCLQYPIKAFLLQFKGIFWTLGALEFGLYSDGWSVGFWITIRSNRCWRERDWGRGGTRLSLQTGDEDNRVYRD